MEGKVKFFNEAKGFGFITDSEGKDHFVHKSGLKESTALKVGDAVVFELMMQEGKEKAHSVVLKQKK